MHIPSKHVFEALVDRDIQTHHECQVLHITFSFFIRSTNCGMAYAKM